MPRSPRTWTAALPVALVALALGGCTGAPSMLDPQGPAAATIARVWWVMFWGATAILAGVMALALYAVLRRPQRRRPVPAVWLIGGGGLALPVLALSALLVYGFNIGSPPADGEPLAIEVTGHQWWWEVRYPGDGPPVVTANEIHIPAGQPIALTLRSADVIHSLWVPQLGGKLDLIPGRAAVLTLRADAPGDYRGQCAEFCGAQHARMALWVIAREPQEFAAWRRRQAQPAPPPAGAAATRGRERFLSERCVECHTVRGTPARGRKGPDLTHVAERRFLGAGTLANGPGAIARWIADHQRLKPGNRMERFDQLEPQAIADIAAFLGRDR